MSKRRGSTRRAARVTEMSPYAASVLLNRVEVINPGDPSARADDRVERLDRKGRLRDTARTHAQYVEHPSDPPRRDRLRKSPVRVHGGNPEGTRIPQPEHAVVNRQRVRVTANERLAARDSHRPRTGVWFDGAARELQKANARMRRRAKRRQHA